MAKMGCYFVANFGNRIFYYEYEVSRDRLESTKRYMLDLDKTIASVENDAIPTMKGFHFDGGFSNHDGREWRHKKVVLPERPRIGAGLYLRDAGYEREDKDVMKQLKAEIGGTYPGKVLRLGYRPLPERPRKVREMCLVRKNPDTGGKEYESSSLKAKNRSISRIFT